MSNTAPTPSDGTKIESLLEELAEPFSLDELEAYPVSMLVNAPRINIEELTAKF